MYILSSAVKGFYRENKYLHNLIILLLIYLDWCSHIYCLFCPLDDKKVEELLIHNVAARFCMLYIRSCILFIHVVHFIVMMIFKLIFEMDL